MKNSAYLKGPVLCALLILLPIFYGASHSALPYEDKAARPLFLKEAFEPALFEELQSMDQLVSYVSGTYSGPKNSLGFVHHIAEVISRRFYSGYSHYNSDDDWIAAFAGKSIWSDLSAIVIPDDILKHPNASCSQQSIVLMECVRHFGFPFRQVIFDHHFTVEVMVDGQWQYIDPNIEVISPGGSTEDLIRSNRFAGLYRNKLSEKMIHTSLAHPRWGKVNATAGSNARLFQRASHWLSANMIYLVMLLQTALFFAISFRRSPTGNLEP